MKMNFLKGILFSSVLFVSCADDLTELNVDGKNPQQVNPDFIYASAEYGTNNTFANPNVNDNHFLYFTQQVTECQYIDEARYNLLKRSMPDRLWNSFYYQLNKLEIAKKELGKTPSAPKVQANKLASIEALELYLFSALVDTYGDVPYTEALNVEKGTPKYDDALTIYKSLITRADNALATIDDASATFSTSKIFKNGKTVRYFINSLKLRMGLNLADLDNAYAKSVVESAASALPKSNSDNLLFKFDATGVFTSPTYLEYVASGRNDFVPANTFVNHMNAKLDPRRDAYFTKLQGDFVGGKYGEINAFDDFSHVTAPFIKEDYANPMFTYSDNEFMLAEAVERGFAVGGTAKTHFENGITASMKNYGVSDADIATYLAANDYTTLPGTWKEKIGLEAWVSNYFRGFDAWVSSRRLDFKAFAKPSTHAVPTRIYYPIKEGAINKENKDAAVVKQFGALTKDVQGSKIFWDKN